MAYRTGSFPSRKYVIGLLIASLAGCSEKRPETTARVTPEANAPLGRPAVADTVPGTGGVLPRVVVLVQLPPRLRQPGQLLEAWRWPDANGDNLLVVFRRDSVAPAPPPRPAAYAFHELADGAGPARTAWLSVRQYVRRRPADAYKELWRLRDFVADCPLALTLGPRPGSVAITDLDHDGRTETTLVYRLACRSGGASAGLKLILRAGAAKYALRGATVGASAAGPANPCCGDKLPAARRRVGDTGGYYQNEAGFRGAPPAFLRFARQHWQQCSLEDE